MYWIVRGLVWPAFLATDWNSYACGDVGSTGSNLDLASYVDEWLAGL